MSEDDWYTLLDRATSDEALEREVPCPVMRLRIKSRLANKAMFLPVCEERIPS